MKRIITAGLTLALLVAMTAASASGPGSASDPLITKSYMEGEYTDRILSDADKAIDRGLQAVYDKAAAPYDSPSSEVTYTSGRQLMLAKSGGELTVLAGGYLTLLEGGLSVTVRSGQVLDLSRGEAVSDGAALSSGRRYLCAEDTRALFTASAPSLMLLEGPYISNGLVGKPELIYDDVTGVEWFADAAAYAKSIGMFPDSGGSTFRSSASVSRAEMVYGMWKAAGMPSSAGVLPYNDLRETWYLDAVAWATEKEIVTGTGGPNFSPDMGLDRQQLATMLYRYARATGKDTSARVDLNKFVDRAQIGDWALDSLSWAVAAGVIHGTSDTEELMSPTMSATRGQVATVLMRMI